MAQWKLRVSFILILSLNSPLWNCLWKCSNHCETFMAFPRNLHGFVAFPYAWGVCSVPFSGPTHPLLGHALQAAQGRSVSRHPLQGSAACPEPPAPLLRGSRAQEKCHGRWLCWVILTNGNGNSTGSRRFSGQKWDLALTSWLHQQKWQVAIDKLPMMSIMSIWGPLWVVVPAAHKIKHVWITFQGFRLGVRLG